MQSLSIVLTLLWSLGNCSSQLVKLNVTQTSFSTVASATTPSSYEKCQVCCYSIAQTQKEARMQNIMNTVDNVFSRKKQVDFAIIVKNSQGFLDIRLQQVLEFLKNLIAYLEWKELLIIHPDHARISIYTFADQATIKMDGISDSSAFYDACMLNATINEITIKSQSKNSDPAPVLELTANTFERSRRDAVKVLFFFDNGDYNGDNSKPSANAMATILRMRDMGVYRFAAGVGKPNDGWMNSEIKEQNVQSVASDENNYYACLEEWIGTFHNALVKMAVNKQSMYKL